MPGPTFVVTPPYEDDAMATQLPLLDLRDATVAPKTAPSRASAVRSIRPSPAGRPAPRSSSSSLAGSGLRSQPRAGADSEAGPVPAYWRLDQHTCEVGRRGVEDARRALAAAVKRVGAAA
jgi:hypothetical protein